MKHTSCRKLTPDAVVGRVARALAASRAVDRSVRMPTRFVAVEPALIRQVPAWVARAGILKSPRAWWLWCEPRRGRARDGQCVLDLPDGRYLVETLDTRSFTWVSCEAAAGSPLVIGLPYTGRPVLACIQRVALVARAQTPRRARTRPE